MKPTLELGSYLKRVHTEDEVVKLFGYLKTRHYDKSPRYGIRITEDYLRDTYKKGEFGIFLKKVDPPRYKLLLIEMNL